MRGFFFKDMFKSLYRLMNNFEQLNGKTVLLRVLDKGKVENYILDLNRINQLLIDGENTKGNDIGYYRRNHPPAIYKGVSAPKRVGNPIVLYDTGKFFKSFDVIKDSSGFFIEADDRKAKGVELAKVYGKDILGLSTESRNELIKTLIPILREEIRTAILK